jgi:hypothetical protein
VTKHRRPIAHSKDIGAMSMVKLGSGVNLLGYYMYHGGTNPIGSCSTLQESKETGYPNDLPILNYDFNGPIREYGQISETFKEIKLLAMFIKDFGEEFCKMQLYLPPENPLYQTDFVSLRTSVRHNLDSGYLFLNNYQRRYEMTSHPNVKLKITHLEETIEFPKMDIKDQDYAFYPFNMLLGKAKLRCCLATPLCKLSNRETTFVFYTDSEPCYEIEGELEDTNILTLSREQAKNAYKVVLDQEYLVISDALILDKKDEICVIGRLQPRFCTYPKLSKEPEGFTMSGSEKEFTIYEQAENIKLEPENLPEVTIKKLTSENATSLETVDYELILEYKKGTTNRNDAFLRLDYEGDGTQLILDGEMVADHFYTGQIWEIGLKRFAYPAKLTLKIQPLYKDTKVFLEQWPVMESNVVAKLKTAQVETEYVAIIKKDCF